MNASDPLLLTGGDGARESMAEGECPYAYGASLHSIVSLLLFMGGRMGAMAQDSCAVASASEGNFANGGLCAACWLRWWWEWSNAVCIAEASSVFSASVWLERDRPTDRLGGPQSRSDWLLSPPTHPRRSPRPECASSPKVHLGDASPIRRPFYALAVSVYLGVKAHTKQRSDRANRRVPRLFSASLPKFWRPPRVAFESDRMTKADLAERCIIAKSNSAHADGNGKLMNKDRCTYPNYKQINLPLNGCLDTVKPCAWVQDRWATSA